ncbi:uncharacterized protein LOC112450532 [Kryptolebias marmoratus]|uniref:uncharacterized protein LOC112450532 n=1 Tax=Kryptolebias marmoratus TaxID=37003 RepID=UPI000D530898|nr:uncharacterized protein LOC112450532 [Kryptolebias marmoratus]
MVKRRCPEGQKWDILLSACHSWQNEATTKPPSTTKPVLMVVDQLRTKITTSKATMLPTMLVLSQTLWICVVLVTLGSILALTLWFVIFRRKTRVSSNFEDPVPEPEFLPKTEPPIKCPPPHSDRNLACQRAAEAPSPCHQLYPRGQTESKWEDGFTVCSGPARRSSKEGELAVCSAVADHRVPLPATELGGTVLVTTKTL